ncbi:MAG: hypothetical protein Q8S00_04440 [Deltaproteobacteria bacterium]|nr:hypothetical protein [Deltaproteobacteria bacterium]
MSDQADAFAGKLFTQFPSDAPYPSNAEFQAHLLEQYKLYVEMADRISQRRQTANSYFLTVNTALLSFVGYLTTKDTSDYLWLLGVVGVVLCYLWYRLVRSYRDLNTAKFNVIHVIEKRLPLSPYDAEWEAMGRGKDSTRYKPVTHIETGVPWVFVVLHVFVFYRMFPWALLRTWLQ